MGTSAMTDIPRKDGPRTEAGRRIDALRRAIDKAVAGLNEAWGGFGPSEALEAVIGDLQRARTADDIAQGRDWPPVVEAEAAEPRPAGDASVREGPAPNVPECTCNRDDDSWVGEDMDMPLCPYHEKRLRHLSWESLACMVIDYEAALATPSATEEESGRDSQP